jgi:DNA polymerase-3 subunit delta
MLYILHGPDEFSRAEKITELKTALGDPTTADFNVSVLDGRGVTLNDIRRDADSMPFLAPRRLVIVTGYVSAIAAKKDDTQALADYLSRLAPTTDLVLAEDDTLRKGHTILKAAEAAGGQILTFGELDKGNLAAWIVKRAKDHGVVIEPDAADLLGRLVGADRRVLNNEIEKLVLYVDGQRPITKPDVDLLVPYTEDAEQFGISNAIGQRNARKAYDQIHKELEEKHPMQILGSITAQIRTLIEVKDMAEHGLPAAEIARRKGWKSEYAATMRLREASNFTMTRLEQIFEMLLDTDLAIKTGKIDMLLALDTLVARLCSK